MSTKAHNRAIAQAMEFTTEDLTFNQRGQFSSHQRLKLEVMRDMFISDMQDAPLLHLPSIILLLIFMGLVGFLQMVGLSDRLTDALNGWYLPLLMGAGGLILLWFLRRQFLYQVARAVLPTMLDEMTLSPELHSVTGTARVVTEALPIGMNYWLIIGDLHFPLTTKAGNAFQSGHTYRVFYVHFADATVLMSAEWLTDH